MVHPRWAKLIGLYVKVMDGAVFGSLVFGEVIVLRRSFGQLFDYCYYCPHLKAGRRGNDMEIGEVKNGSSLR